MLLGSVLGEGQKILVLFYCAPVLQDGLVQDVTTLGEDPFYFLPNTSTIGCDYLLVVTTVLRLGEWKQSRKGQLEYEGKRYRLQDWGAPVVHLQIDTLLL